MDKLSRRDLLKTAGVAGTAAVVGPHRAEAQTNGGQPANADQPSTAPSAAPTSNVLYFFNSEEARFVETAAERLIPGDSEWGGAAEAGVLYYIDKQLASAWGAGARMYLKGPWDPKAPPQQGYQLRYSPAELYRVAIAEIRSHLKDQGGGELWDMQPNNVDQVLSGLESGDIQLPSVPSPVFFETLLANTIEGYFSDPIYGGNRDMVSWRMVGFPGAYAQYVGLVDQHGYAFTREPVGISNADQVLGAAGHTHKNG